MASVQIAHNWDDGTTTMVTVSGKASYPQVIHELKAAAIEAFQEAVAYTIAAQAPVEP